MSTNSKGLTQQASSLFQNATMQIKNILSNDGNIKTPTNECIIYDRPSTIDDTNECIFNTNEKKTDDLFKHEPDLSEEDHFRACFIDCSCDCSVCIYEVKSPFFIFTISRLKKSHRVE
jgi:hypothetical protein